jgi:hypothetical protein
MKTRTVLATNIALLMLATAALQAADQMTLYTSKPGGLVRVEGTANIHHPIWFMESPTIGGLMEVGPGFPTEPGQSVTPGKVEAKARLFIPVHSLKSVEDGKPYSDRMDQLAWEHLKEQQFQMIYYSLTELTLKEPAKSKDAPYVCEAKGNLTISGVTNATTMTVEILPVVTPNGEKKLEITGKTVVKMTEYKVEPVDINLVIGHIKIGEDVKLSFKWVLGQKKAAAAAK